MKIKSNQLMELYEAVKEAAKQKSNGEIFIFNDLVRQAGTFYCSSNEIREVGRMFGAWERNGCDAPIKRLSNKSPIKYQKLQFFVFGGNN